MILYIVATRDIVADLYGTPQYVPALGQAVRSFGDACLNSTDPNNIIGKHPSDFELYHLGSFDDHTGQFQLLDQPKQIAVGANYRQQ